jgi:hypothetical protein
MPTSTALPINVIYNPLKFVQQIELLTLTMIGSFASWRLMNVIYDNIYEPVVDHLVDCGGTDKYYLKIGRYYVQIGIVFKEIIKWIIIVIVLMLIYNIIN